jgi:hypothetical protein
VLEVQGLIIRFLPSIDVGIRRCGRRYSSSATPLLREARISGGSIPSWFDQTPLGLFVEEIVERGGRQDSFYTTVDAGPRNLPNPFRIG